MTQYMQEAGAMKQLTDELMIPKECRQPMRKDDEPVYFAVLEAAWRHPDSESMPLDAPNRYHRTRRDDPLANEFRAYFHIEHGMQSVPLGPNREDAERIVQILNAAYNFGLVHAKQRSAEPRIQPVLVGRMGHCNRNERQMP